MNLVDINDVKNKSVIAQVPFPGFYQTWFEDGFDRALEQNAERLANEHSLDDVDGFQAALLSTTDWALAHNHIAQKYVKKFNAEATDKLGFNPDLAFESLRSPKEYNVETDRIFVKLPLESVIRLGYALNKQTLGETIKKRHSSYEGFISHYTTDLDFWTSKPLDSWDHNELCTLIVAAFASQGVDVDELASRISEHLSEQGEYDEALAIAKGGEQDAELLKVARQSEGFLDRPTA